MSEIAIELDGGTQWSVETQRDITHEDAVPSRGLSTVGEGLRRAPRLFVLAQAAAIQAIYEGAASFYRTGFRDIEQ